MQILQGISTYSIYLFTWLLNNIDNPKMHSASQSDFSSIQGSKEKLFSMTYGVTVLFNKQGLQSPLIIIPVRVFFKKIILTSQSSTNILTFYSKMFSMRIYFFPQLENPRYPQCTSPSRRAVSNTIIILLTFG